MFCNPTLFALCNDLKAWGILPSFEVGQVVARGFADIGSEEFLVLPGEKLLSLSAGTIKPLPEDHKEFFFWIPTEDECAKQLDRLGVLELTVRREQARRWIVSAQLGAGELEVSDKSLRHAMILLLLEAKKRSVATD